MRYILFGGFDILSPEGGCDDILGASDDSDDLIARAHTIYSGAEPSPWGQIYDTKECRVILKYAHYLRGWEEE